jgi:hypothetical protein
MVQEEESRRAAGPRPQMAGLSLQAGVSLGEALLLAVARFLWAAVPQVVEMPLPEKLASVERAVVLERAGRQASTVARTPCPPVNAKFRTASTVSASFSTLWWSAVSACQPAKRMKPAKVSGPANFRGRCRTPHGDPLSLSHRTVFSPNTWP